MGYHYLEPLPESQRKSFQIEDYHTFKQKELPERSEKALDEILAVCNERGIRVIFFATPYAGNFYYHDAMTRYAAEHDCYYLDFFEKMEEAGLTVPDDFWDKNHLNDQGARKLADYLGRFITQNLPFKDMREVEENLWESALMRTQKV